MLLPNRLIGRLTSLALFRPPAAFFEHNAGFVTSTYMVSVAASIAVMTAVLGGLGSTYYCRACTS